MVIREREPARLGSTDAAFRGDVETIVGKALEKDKVRRYRLCGGSGRGSQARPCATSRSGPGRRRLCTSSANSPGGTGRWWAACWAIFAALVLGTITSILFAIRAERNARRRRWTRSASAGPGVSGPPGRRGRGPDRPRRGCRRAPARFGPGGAARPWEWRHLRSRLDDSSSVIPLPAESGRSPDRCTGPAAGLGRNGRRLAHHGPGGRRAPESADQHRAQAVCHRHPDPPRAESRGCGSRTRPLTCWTRPARFFVAWRCRRTKGRGPLP